jgi:hypothetical protein
MSNSFHSFSLNTLKMVGDSIKRNKVFLRNLALAKSAAKRELLLKQATRDELLAVLETCWNVLNFRFPLKSHHRRKLSKHAPYLRRLARARSVKSVRNILQRGGGGVFGALLLPVLSALVGSAISSRI